MRNVIVSAVIAEVAAPSSFCFVLTHSVCLCESECVRMQLTTHTTIFSLIVNFHTHTHKHDTLSVDVYVWYHLMRTITHSLISEWNASACYNLRTISIYTWKPLDKSIVSIHQHFIILVSRSFLLKCCLLISSVNERDRALGYILFNEMVFSIRCMFVCMYIYFS